MKYLISAGSNLSLSTQTPSMLLKHAQELLANAFGSVVASKYYSNPAYPAGYGPDFVNTAFSITAQIEPEELLDYLHSIEAAMGRERIKRWHARVIDLDLLAAEDLILPNPEEYERWRNLPPSEQVQRAPEQLILPHPRLQDRPFVLLPLRDIAPDWQHPVLKLTVRQMCSRLSSEAIASCTELSQEM